MKQKQNRKKEGKSLAESAAGQGNLLEKCPQCGVFLYRSLGVCPLCQCVTEELQQEEADRVKGIFGSGAPYPDVRRMKRLLRFIMKLVLFLFVVAEIVMILINYLTSVSYPWSLITGVVLIYIYLFLVYWINYDSGFAAKVGLQLLITMAFLFGIDYLNGMRGWSLQWAIPGIILLGDGIVFFLMMLNRSRWQSYLLLLLLMGVCSVTIIVLYFTGKIAGVVMPLICFAVTCLFIFGTILFGGSAAGRELKRRMHI